MHLRTFDGQRMYLIQNGLCRLSNMYLTPLSHHDISFNSVEQLYQSEKASYFHDNKVAFAIMDMDDPNGQKRLGGSISNFSLVSWLQESDEIMRMARLLKFNSDKEAKMALLVTGKALIVDASTMSEYWSIGLQSNDPRCRDPKQFKGLNKLGKLLMEIRSMLTRDDGRKHKGSGMSSSYGDSESD